MNYPEVISSVEIGSYGSGIEVAIIQEEEYKYRVYMYDKKQKKNLKVFIHKYLRRSEKTYRKLFREGRDIYFNTK